jgi:predicted RNase H-like nuclease (RuvC/YqgF family)
MRQISQDRRLKEIESEISQLHRRLGEHQGKAESIRRQLAKLTDMRKSLAKKGGCLHRNLEQKFTARGISFICADCGEEVMDVPASERNIADDARIRDLTHRS